MSFNNQFHAFNGPGREPFRNLAKHLRFCYIVMT